MYSIGNNQLGGLPSSYNYLYQTSQILTQTSPYYYASHQNQGGFHGGYSREYQMGFQGGSQLMGLNSLNYIGQSQGGSSQIQGQQQQHQHLGQSTSLQDKHSQQNQHQNHHNHPHQNRNSESHEKENHSKERSVKRNNSNVIRDRSNEKLSFNKSTPHFFPQQDNLNSHNNNSSGGNYQSSNNSNNSGHVFMTSSSGNPNTNLNSNNNTGSQTNLKDNDKINQIQKIYNNNIRSRNNFHKSQNNFYNTHSNAFFNSNSNGQNNGSLDQRKKNNGLSSRLSQSPSNDVKVVSQQGISTNTGQLTRKYYPSQQIAKFSSQVSLQSSQNQNPLTQFQKENNNLANIYSKEYKTNRNSLTSGKGLEKKDTLSQIYKPQAKGSLNLGYVTSKNSQITNQNPAFANANTQSKFYQTEPNFNKKPSRKSLTVIKPTIKSQLKPIEDLIMNENMSSQNQIGRKYFSNTSTNNQNINLFSSQNNKWSLTPKQQFNSSNAFSKQKKKEEIIPIQKKSKTFGSEDRKNQGRDSNIDNDYDYDMEYDEPFEQSQQSQKNPEQIYNYEIEMDLPLSSQLSKTKVLTQVDEENVQFKNSLATNEDLVQDQQPDSSDNGNEQTNDKNKFLSKSQMKDSFKKEDKNNDQKKDEDKIVYQKQYGYSLQQSNYLENRKSNNNFELEVIQEQNKEDEVKEVPADLLQQVQKISEARPKTSEGGRRRRKLKQFQQQTQENAKVNEPTGRETKNQEAVNNAQAKTTSRNTIENKKSNHDEVKEAQLGTIQSKRKNQSNGQDMYDLLENSPKQLDFSPLKTAQMQNEKEDYSNNEYDDDFEECESEQRDGRYNKNQFFRSQAEFYRPTLGESDFNYNSTHYGGSSFKYGSTLGEGKKKDRMSFRKTTNEGFFQNDQELQPQQPKMYNLFKRNISTNDEDSYQQSLPSHRIAPNGDIPLEVHVQEEDNEYVYQETSHRKKVLLKKKTIDTSDGHKIIIRHNKSAAGPKRVPKQQGSNIEEQQPQQQQQQSQQVQKQIEPQDDVVERVVVPFKTGLDNEFINLFAAQL